MKYKITRKLVLYFTAVILLFSLVVGGAFLLLFTRHTEEIYRADMQERAEAIAAGVADYLESGSSSFEEAVVITTGNVSAKQAGNSQLAQSGATGTTGHSTMSGYNTYITAIQDIAMGEVWIVDQSAETISVGTGKKEITYAELPGAALALVDEVFEGDVAFSEGFSPLLEDASITVGAPVLSEEGEVIAAVLLHGYVANMQTAVRSGFSTLGISLALALIAAVSIAVLLAKRFIEPLKRMEETTQQLADNHYEAQTGIIQNDEMGSLAANIDILADKLAEAAQESAKLDKMRKDFITSISHELRTPVTVIRGSLEALNDHVVEDPAKIDEYHQQMLTESIHLERMINDLLELSRLQNPDYHMEMTSLNFVDVVENAIRSVRYIAREKGITLTFAKEPLAFMLMGDYTRLRQMLLAVMENAVKFSSEKGEIRVSLTASDAGYRLSISDDGPGIPEKDQPYIFEKFFKSNEETNKQGTGLGLAVAKQIADRHGIALSVESTPGKGSTFIFDLKQ
ncbi:histidine kinase [Trichococcus patagoniensis]|uniref:histidine kinase n=1 Tax=Trichococcus patagoniensis TaxID=382641 RepID=A0A2T5INU0_9LACT|nr:HAMP domain-containing sensor histidine kinase [Trichococcus patagoniensis]PTQ85501.1 histidine kinase [Trichococcus patagoniensis]